MIPAIDSSMWLYSKGSASYRCFIVLSFEGTSAAIATLVLRWSLLIRVWIINPWDACAARVIVVVSCMCVFACVQNIEVHIDLPQHEENF